MNGKIGVVGLGIVFLVLTNICVANEAESGRWSPRDASKAFYSALAKIAASVSSKEHGQNYTVVKVLEAYEKTSPAHKYKLKMEVDLGTCKGKPKRKDSTREPQGKDCKRICTAVIHIPSAMKKGEKTRLDTRVTSFGCQ
uniref:Salivary cystatin 2 n=1 Tax=Ornithodoros coriaceus TaxID=92741 RepID=B2D2A2_ORNCO|nr:salivary cystatin 2 [Ornithodoros coriaceus]